MRSIGIEASLEFMVLRFFGGLDFEEEEEAAAVEEGVEEKEEGGGGARVVVGVVGGDC
jgi:hypothetical protein